MYRTGKKGFLEKEQDHLMRTVAKLLKKREDRVGFCAPESDHADVSFQISIYLFLSRSLLGRARMGDKVGT